MSEYRSEDIKEHMHEEQRRHKPRAPLDEEKIKEKRERKTELLQYTRSMTWKVFEERVVIGIHGAMPGTPEHASFRSLYLASHRHE
jgi:hypothetical protein